MPNFKKIVQLRAEMFHMDGRTDAPDDACRVQMDRWAVWGDSWWIAINLPHTCLVSRRLQEGSARYDITKLAPPKTPEAHKYRRPGRLNFVGWWPTICGSWVRNLVHATHLAPGILSWLHHLQKICAPWCNLLQKGLLHWKLWETQPRSQAVWTVNAFLCHRLHDT